MIIKRPLPLTARTYPVAHPVPPGITPRCASGQRLGRRTAAAWPCGDGQAGGGPQTVALSLARQRQTHMEVVRSRLLVSMLVAHYSMCLTMCLMILDTNISDNHIEGSSSERYSWVVDAM